jgi:hypothetical protein
MLAAYGVAGERSSSRNGAEPTALLPYTARRHQTRAVGAWRKRV